jgi:hypothetical protein
VASLVLQLSAFSSLPLILQVFCIAKERERSPRVVMLSIQALVLLIKGIFGKKTKDSRSVEQHQD